MSEKAPKSKPLQNKPVSRDIEGQVIIAAPPIILPTDDPDDFWNRLVDMTHNKLHDGKVK